MQKSLGPFQMLQNKIRKPNVAFSISSCSFFRLWMAWSMSIVDVVPEILKGHQWNYFYQIKKTTSISREVKNYLDFHFHTPEWALFVGGSGSFLHHEPHAAMGAIHKWCSQFFEIFYPFLTLITHFTK